MLTSVVKKRLEVPGEAGQWIEIRKLGWRKLREASEAQQREAYAMVRVLGADGLAAIRAVTAEQIAAFQRNSASTFDQGTLLRAAVTAWSYSDKPTVDELDELDEEMATWLVNEIVALARPPRDEQASKNV